MKAKYKHIEFNLIEEKISKSEILTRLQETMKGAKISENEINDFITLITKKDYHYMILKIIDNFDCKP